MSKVEAAVQKAEVNAAIIRELRITLESLKTVEEVQFRFPVSGMAVDLKKDIARVTLALALLGHNES